MVSTCNALLIAPSTVSPLLGISATATAHALGLVFALSTDTITSPTAASIQSQTIIIQQQQKQATSPQEAAAAAVGGGGSGGPIPILEIVKVYGKLAGSECYGKPSPSGSSCQIQLKDIQQTVSTLSRNEFSVKLNSNEYVFQWPLKPYGLEKSLSKTATMNKGAETRVFMEELEDRGLYNPRNPTGPLPTSLRPALNKALQKEGILDSRAIDITYNAFTAEANTNTDSNTVTNSKEDGDNNNGEYVDYYTFLKMIGTESISWPK
ncbi:hypothetical protein FRACYDRAFT_239654 [Fragilariopsis cylindrus CCMP1102]|uniref:Uncharacterized protein n=1 Tax=Fragilariopsis cylindrus CCMP1102 TaxID=635003 RepID=A0A1E7FFV1_9STRA|nr:hypothetical protein FRACYDRAFT_239654 [Fragilariopsis cylindrus CCMP1102]|eukprot:OEU17051.1 hypothetical protein FRACYDRAFT_239654 [Fragilariopsis cylindrus CCMP1102]